MNSASRTTKVLEAIPPLCAGDHLTVEEFIRRWESAPRVKFAELIRGRVYMPSPVTLEHGRYDNIVATWIGNYQTFTPGTDAGSNATAFVLGAVPQPDQHLRIHEQSGGNSRVEGKYLQGSPELMVEICKSSAAYDLHEKLELYRAAKVQEYLAFLVFEREVQWRRLTKRGDYKLQPADADGIHRSKVFPGLWLDGAALFELRRAQVFKTLKKGLASTEHRQFVQRLAKRSKS